MAVSDELSVDTAPSLLAGRIEMAEPVAVRRLGGGIRTR